VGGRGPHAARQRLSDARRRHARPGARAEASANPGSRRTVRRPRGLPRGLRSALGRGHHHARAARHWRRVSHPRAASRR
jgi:hypothetical protein